MSAASSGYELPLIIIPPSRLGDLDGIKIGTILTQRRRILDSPQDRFSQWYIRSIKPNRFIIAPIRGLLVGEIRIMTESELWRHFYVTNRRSC